MWLSNFPQCKSARSVTRFGFNMLVMFDIGIFGQNIINRDSVPYVYNMLYRIDKSTYTNSDMQADVAAGAYSSGHYIRPRSRKALYHDCCKATGALIFIFVALATGIPGILAPVYETAAMPYSAR